MTPLTNRFAPRTSPTGLAIALLLASALALPPAAEAQRAVRRDGGGSAAGSGGSSGGSGDSSGGSSRRNPESSTPSAPSSGGSTAPRGSGGTASSTPSGNGASGGERSRRGSSDDVPTYSRPREGQTATGTAVARRGAPPSGGGTDIIYVPGGGYYPWGYGGFGFGGYYGSSYDPWYNYYNYYNSYSYYDPSYGGGQYSSGNYGDASLRIKVRPRDASVYADGYYVGRVDDFDGMFQRLHIEPGPHRIEIRADGYETLEFEVRLLPDRTLTYEGELRPRP